MLDSSSPYRELYAAAKRQAWDPSTIDLAIDRNHWGMIRRGYARERYDEQIILLCSVLHAGASALTRALAPCVGASARLGLGAEVEACLAAQLFEAAKHREFVERYGREVMEEAAAPSGAGMRAPLAGALHAAGDRIRREDDRQRLTAALAEGVAQAVGLVEALLARALYRGTRDALAARGWLPGLQIACGLVCRDHARHLVFASQLLRELTARDPALRAAIGEALARDQPAMLAMAGLDAFDVPLLEPAVARRRALEACAQFAAALEPVKATNAGIAPLPLGIGSAGGGARAELRA